MADTSDDLLAKLEASSTNWRTTTFTALGVLLWIGHYQQVPLPPDISVSQVKQDIVQGTLDGLAREARSEELLFFALSRIYDQLLAEQVDLDPQARALLHGHRWDLYE